METHLADFIRDTEQGREADRILRACVHCGFCTATCPTYQLLGDELDGPRGRIYLIKQVLEGHPVTRKTQGHLDRCLTCLNCMTTCPSGVHYAHLVDIGREVVDERVPRPLAERAMRWGLRRVIPHRRRFEPLLRLGQSLRPLVPAALRRKIPERRAHARPGTGVQPRKVVMLEGCVTPALTPATNAAAVEVLDRLGIEVVATPRAGCCGAVSQHLSAPDEARAFMRRNIDAWWPHIEAGAEAVVITASGCGAIVKEYGYHLRDDPRYAEKAARVAAFARDLSEVLAGEDLSALEVRSGRRIAFHPPCTLQHGQQLKGVVEGMLAGLGFELLPVPEAHLCCGSAGTYAILQADLSQQLLERRIEALESGGPELIATANVGCQTHLETRASVPVVHWIELLAGS
jgi:glycolate oxidase iron-sulfur subunit